MTATVLPLKWQREIFGVTDDNFHIMLDEYHVSERMLKDSVLLIRDWYSKQPHLPNVEFEDRTLGRLLAICKFSVETTKEKMDNKFTAANMMPEFFSNRDPWSPEIIKALDVVDWGFIPKLSPENYRVQIMRINEDDNAYDPVTSFASAFMIAEMRLILDIAVGDIYIWDLANLKLSHVVKMTPPLMKKTMFVAQRCYGTHIRGIHIINLPPYAELVVKTIKTVLKKKVADRIFIHKTNEDFHKALPKDLIPKDLGGDFPKTCGELADEVRAAVRSPEWRSWYLESTEQKTDESKRIGKSETMEDDLLGLRGTFRKLDID